MTKLIEFKSIDHKTASLLGKMGIDSAEMLLEHGRSPQGRIQLARQMLISSRRILNWVQLADLMRVNGVGCDYAELLYQVGIKTVKELAASEAAPLRVQLDRANRQRHIVRRVPAVSRIAGWIERAQQLNALVET